MQKIPVRQITTPHKPVATGRFKIRNVADILKCEDLVHDLHRHDFYFILALEEWEGKHVIDFTPYNVHHNSIFIIRPGQVHQLELKAGCTGFLAEFDKAFYHPKDKLANQRLIKAGNMGDMNLLYLFFKVSPGYEFQKISDYLK